MHFSRYPFLRHQVIDKCLCNRQRRWTLEDLMDACNETLNEIEGNHKTVSKRTIQYDLEKMRKGKMGYFAPIKVVEKKYYTYEDPDFSIFNHPISDGELDYLKEALNMLKQFSQFSYLTEIEGMVKRLENKIQVVNHQENPVIDLNLNESLKGLKFLDEVHQAILKKNVLKIKYLPFKKQESIELKLHPYLLKTYNDRWYVVGFSDRRNRTTILGLDRFEAISIDRRAKFEPNTFFKPHLFFKDVIGITVDLNQPVEEIQLQILPEIAPYIITKPIHTSQEIIQQSKSGITVRLQLRINHELKEIVRGMGANVVVVKPAHLRETIIKDHQKALLNYQTYITKNLID